MSGFSRKTPTYKEIILVIMLEQKMEDTVHEVICDNIDLLIKWSYENTKQPIPPSL